MHINKLWIEYMLPCGIIGQNKLINKEECQTCRYKSCDTCGNILFFSCAASCPEGKNQDNLKNHKNKIETCEWRK